MSFGGIFNDLYRRNGWDGIESRSGPGSGDRERADLGPAIVALVADCGFRSVLDVGCGECYWTPELPGYIGVDVSDVALEVARAAHPDRDFRLVDELLPPADLALCRCVMQHLSLHDGQILLERMTVAASWLLATSYPTGSNHDITTGGGYWIDLRVEPFWLGEPQAAIPDPGAGKEGILGLWKL